MSEPYDHSAAKEDARNGEEYDHSRAKEDARNAGPDAPAVRPPGWVPCPTCQGYEGCTDPDWDGEGDAPDCPLCDGTGWVPGGAL